MLLTVFAPTNHGQVDFSLSIFLPLSVHFEQLIQLFLFSFPPAELRRRLKQIPDLERLAAMCAVGTASAQKLCQLVQGLKGKREREAFFVP